MSRHSRLSAAVSALIGLATATVVRADDPGITLYGSDELTIQFSLAAGTGAFAVTNSNFGLGSTPVGGARPRGSWRWWEGWFKPILGAEYAPEGLGQFYGGASAIGSGTRGDGEAQAQSSTSDAPEDLDIEDAFLGWRSGELFPALGEDAIDVSGGHQSFLVGDGFLIADGTQDGWGRGAYYLGPRTAFEATGLLRLNTSPVRADLFHLRSRVDQSRMRASDNAAASLFGANVEWFKSNDDADGRTDYDGRQWYLGLTLFRIYDADSTGVANFSFADGGNGGAPTANRDGLAVLSLRAGGAFLPQWPQLRLYGEAGIQQNGERNRKVRAEAYYLEPQYTFELPWTPRLSYRYAHFSGDDDPGDRTDRSWDPLFNATGPRGIGTWSHGEIYSQYVGANSNVNIHQLHLRAQPIDEELAAGLVLYRFSYDESRQTAGVSAEHLMDEIDLYVEWKPLAGLSVMGALAWARPGTGAKQSLGITDPQSRDIYLGELILSYQF